MQRNSTEFRKSRANRYLFDESELKNASQAYWNAGDAARHRKKNKALFLLAATISMATVIALLAVGIRYIGWMILGTLIFPVPVALFIVSGFMYEYFCKVKARESFLHMKLPSVRTEDTSLCLEYTSTQKSDLLYAQVQSEVYVKKTIAYRDIQEVVLYEGSNLIEFVGHGQIAYYLNYHKKEPIFPLEQYEFSGEFGLAFFLCLKNNQGFLEVLNAHGISVNRKAIAFTLDAAEKAAAQAVGQNPSAAMCFMDKKKFEQMRKAWVKKQPDYHALRKKTQKRILTGLILMVVSCLLCGLAPFTLLSVLLFLVLMITIACYFLSAILGWVMNSRWLGDDFSLLYNPSVSLTDTGIAYGVEGYQYKSNRGRVYKESSISFSDIEYAIYYQEENMIEFFGRGDYIVYMDRKKKITVTPCEDRRFGAQYKMRFFLCLADNQAFLDLLNQYDFEVYER